MVAVAHGRGTHAAGIGSRIGLGLGETSLFLAAQERQQVFLLHLALQRVKNAARGRPCNAIPARRYGDRTREFLPHNDACEDRHAATAILGRHVELPDAQLFRPAFEAAEIIRLDLFAVGGLALDWDQLVVDKTPQRGFEQSQLFRQFEIHRPMLPSRPPATTRARRPRSHPRRAWRGPVPRRVGSRQCFARSAD